MSTSPESPRAATAARIFWTCSSRGDDPLAGHMAALLRPLLVFQDDPGNAGRDAFPYRSHDVEGIAVARVHVRNDRNGYGGRDVAYPVQHFRSGQQTDVRHSQRRGSQAVART